MNGSWWVEIIFLAMLAGFIALRLVSVLGRRTGHERPVGEGYAGTGPEVAQPGGQVIDLPTRLPLDLPKDTTAETKAGLAAIAQADRGFEPGRFAEGAKSAYRMILEGFWKGELSGIEPFMSDEVADQFRAAIAAREAEGLVPDNRIVSLDGPRIVHAQLDGTMAEVSVRYDAKIISVSRDAEGRVVSGTPGEAVSTHDEWTFRRHVATGDPNWLLVATDDDDEDDSAQG